MNSRGEVMVSVVMVVRNVETFVAEAIESILQQTFREFEFIILDFGSNDKTREIVARYAAQDSRIKISEIPPSSYIEAKVAACALPKGRYIAIQDADDVSRPNRLKAEVDFLEQNPEVGLLGGTVQWIDSQGKFLSTVAENPTEDPEIREELKLRNPFWHPTILMRRELYNRVGGYRLAFTQSDDYDLWLRMSEHCQLANLKQVVLNYRIHPQQLSIRKRKDQILCCLAARASTLFRAAGKADPLDSASQVTPEILVGMGVSEAEQKHAIAEGYCFWINHMYAAGGYDTVHEAAADMFKLCDEKSVDPRFISDVHVLSAKSYWRQGKILPGVLSAGRAIRVRPRVVARPLKPLLRIFRAA